MSDESKSGEPQGKVSPGVQAYRWMVGIATGGTMILALSILSTVKETAVDVNALKVDISTVKAMQSHLSSRIEATERRNDTQDAKIDGLWQRFWTMPASPRNGP